MAKRTGPLNELSKRTWRWCRDYRPARRRTDDHLIAHLHSEVAELWEELRLGLIEPYYVEETRYDDIEHPITLRKPKGAPSEVADLVIMAAIIAGKHKIDLDAAIEEKLAELEERLRLKLEWKLG